MARHLLVEVPLLFETGWHGDFDYVVTVYAPAALSVARTVMRDKVSMAQAESILALQFSADEKAKRADSVIDSSGTWAATAVQVSLLARQLQRLGQDRREPSRNGLKKLDSQGLSTYKGRSD
jgi:dephospho-CoA kinase